MVNTQSRLVFILKTTYLLASVDECNASVLNSHRHCTCTVVADGVFIVKSNAERFRLLTIVFTHLYEGDFISKRRKLHETTFHVICA